MFKTVWAECILINFSITDPLLYFLKEICRSQKFIGSVWSRSGIRYHVCCLNHVRWSKCFFLIDEPVNTKLFEWSLLLHLFETLTHPLKKWPRFLRVTCNTGNFTFGCPTEDWSLDDIKHSPLKSCFKLDASKMGPQNHLSHMRIVTKKCRARLFLLFIYAFASLASVGLHWIYVHIIEKRNRIIIF